MVPDDVGAGERLVRMLVDAAHARGRSSPEGPVRLIAIEGQLGDTSAKQRRLGLRQALSGAKDVELLQGVTAARRREESQRKTLLLLRRYPELQAVWAANDDLALGAARALEEAGRHPGEDVLVGGIDWTPEALEAVREGRLVTSLGGHFLEGAWALVLLYDHHRGRDFASERLDWRTAFLPATRANAAGYLEVLARPDWEAFDFRAFSKAANPRLRHYAFSPRHCSRSGMAAWIRMANPESHAPVTSGAQAREPGMTWGSRWLRSGNRLGRRLLLYILLFSTAVSLLGTLVQLGTDYEREVRQLEERFTQIRSSYAQGLAESLWTLDETLLRTQLEGITTLPGIVVAELDTELGTHYVAGGGAPGSSPATSRCTTARACSGRSGWAPTWRTPAPSCAAGCSSSSRPRRARRSSSASSPSSSSSAW
ncbi:substrate-binding domain-containing protein [Cystobacter fuscus]